MVAARQECTLTFNYCIIIIAPCLRGHSSLPPSTFSSLPSLSPSLPPSTFSSLPPSLPPLSPPSLHSLPPSLPSSFPPLFLFSPLVLCVCACMSVCACVRACIYIYACKAVLHAYVAGSRVGIVRNLHKGRSLVQLRKGWSHKGSGNPRAICSLYTYSNVVIIPTQMLAYQQPLL